jgi:hypothetical protein
MVIGHMGMDDIEALFFYEPAQRCHVLQIPGHVHMFIQMKTGDRLHAALDGNGPDRLLDARRRRSAGECHVMPVLPELQGKIEGMLGRPGPFPVAEDVQNFHQIPCLDTVNGTNKQPQLISWLCYLKVVAGFMPACGRG